MLCSGLILYTSVLVVEWIYSSMWMLRQAIKQSVQLLSLVISSRYKVTQVDTLSCNVQLVLRERFYNTQQLCQVLLVAKLSDQNYQSMRATDIFPLSSGEFSLPQNIFSDNCRQVLK